MKVTVKFISLVGLKNVKSGDSIEVDEGSDIRRVLFENGLDRKMLRYVKAIVNGTQESLDHILKEGDILDFIIPIGGG